MQDTEQSKCLSCSYASECRHTGMSYVGEPEGILFIGLEPSDEEDLAGRLLVDRSGIRLKLLAKQHLTVPWAYTTVLGCFTHDKQPQKENLMTCWRLWGTKHLAGLNPKIIVCFGVDAATVLVHGQARKPAGFTIEKTRGKMFEVNGIPLMITYSPKATLGKH